MTLATASTTATEICSSTACAINHLADVMEGALAHDWYDVASLVSQALVGVLSVAVAFLSFNLSKRIRGDEERYRNAELRERKRDRKERARQQRLGVAAALRPVLDHNDASHGRYDSQLRSDLWRAVVYSGGSHLPEVKSLVDYIASEYERHATMREQGRNVPRAWTRSTAEGSISTWIRSPKKFSALLGDVRDFLASVDSDG